MNKLKQTIPIPAITLLALTVTLLGCPPYYATVPDVVGEYETEAITAIEAAGLTVGVIDEAYNPDVPAGMVISQIPAAGVKTFPDFPVVLVISLGPEPAPGTETAVLLPGNVPLSMVWIPSGAFLMGSPENERGRSDNEGPQHEVTLEAGFWMSKYTITKDQWIAVMDTTPWSGEEYVIDHPDSPAVYVSWHDAKDFISALGDYTGLSLWLPSEAQWEYAARAGTTTRFYWGDDLDYTQIGDYAWTHMNSWGFEESYAHVVGQKLPNAWGLYDMAGNVWEFCEDDWHSNYNDAPDDGSAWVESPRLGFRVVRGGSWAVLNLYCRSALRLYENIHHKNAAGGFRIAGDFVPEAPHN